MLGDEAFRVIYFSQPKHVPLREPPADTGWGQAEPDYGRTTAAELGRIDGPGGELHPYCPVKAKRLSIAAAESSVKSPSPSTFAYDPKTLPLRVDDAILRINYERNSWFETILPLDKFVDHLRKHAEIQRDEVAAAEPTSSSSFKHDHKMFGPGRRLQHGRPSDSQTLILLQLETDAGPRFDWWDVGNLTFWISFDHARSRRFDCVKAEIEGH
jgi:hypothetical protein